MLGKYTLGEASEVRCRQVAENIARVALSPEFRTRIQILKVSLHPQLFACRCRLMVNDLMSFLPPPTCFEEAYGADPVASFSQLLMELLMNDESSNLQHFTLLFVKLLTGDIYLETAATDRTELRIVGLLENYDDNLFFFRGHEGPFSPFEHFEMVSLANCIHPCLTATIIEIFE
jgi:hypothetical protein